MIQNKVGVVGEKERKLVMEFARAMVAANEIDRSAEGRVLDAMALYALKNNSDVKEVCGAICREIVESHHTEGWRACLAWASHPDCTDDDERAEMLSFAAANADASAIADIMASKAEKRTPAKRKRKAVDDDDDKRPGIGRVMNLRVHIYYCTPVLNLIIQSNALTFNI